VTENNGQSTTNRPIGHSDTEKTSETVMGNEQMDREFNGEKQEDLSSVPTEMNAAWIIRN